MARGVADVALMYAAIAGVDPLDPTTRQEPVEHWLGGKSAGDLRGVRIGVDPAYSLAFVDEDTGSAIAAAIARLQDLGATLVDVSVPAVDDRLRAAVASAFVEAAISHRKTYPSMRKTYSAGYAELLDIGHATSSIDYAAITIWRREFRGHLARMFNSADMLVAPVMPLAPPSVAMMSAMLSGSLLDAAPMMRYTIPFNLAGVPTLTLPMGRTAAGFPLGFQLVGPELSENTLLAAGAAYEDATGFSCEHPAL
jgi:amidase